MLTLMEFHEVMESAAALAIYPLGLYALCRPCLLNCLFDLGRDYPARQWCGGLLIRTSVSAAVIAPVLVLDVPKIDPGDNKAHKCTMCSDRLMWSWNLPVLSPVPQGRCVLAPEDMLFYLQKRVEELKKGLC